MASGDVFTQVLAKDMIPQNGDLNPGKLRTVGLVAGVPLLKEAASGYYFTFRVPANGTPVSTGVTLKILTVDDPNNPSVGLVYRLGVSGAKLVSGTTNIGTVTLGTETTSDVTAAATSGIVTETSMAITTANLNTIAASGNCTLFIRRVGTHANDTHAGVPLLLQIVVTDT